MPLISIVTPAYNAAATIGDTIASVQAQKFRDWEMIIIDDGSSDGTSARVEQESAHDGRIRLVQRVEGGNGPARARNRGLAAATGRYICFLDADDLWLPEKLDHQLRFMQEKNAAISTTAYRRFSSDGRLGRVLRGPDIVTFDTLLKNTCVATSASMHDREHTGPVRMREDLRGHEDLAFWLTLTAQGHDILFLNEDLMRYRVHTQNHSRRWIRSAAWTWKVYREVANLTPAQTALSLAQYGLRAALKRMF